MVSSSPESERGKPRTTQGKTKKRQIIKGGPPWTAKKCEESANVTCNRGGQEK